MKQNSPYPRILAIAPSTRGFGYAVLEGLDTLVDWGGKHAEGDKNAQSLAKATELLKRYEPEMLILPDTSTKDSRRSERIKKLTQQIIKLATSHNVSVKLFSPEQMKRALSTEGQATKYKLAEIIAKRFPDDLASYLPPKRRLWESEHARMNTFEAVALALMPRLKKSKRSLS